MEAARRGVSSEAELNEVCISSATARRTWKSHTRGVSTDQTCMYSTLRIIVEVGGAEQKRSGAEPSRSEPSRNEVEPSRAGQSRAGSAGCFQSLGDLKVRL